MRAVLSIGSNMEDRRALLQTVFDEFADETVAASPVYATPPWGVTDQGDFLNAVLIVDVDCTPLELLRRGQKLEEAAERVRVRRWGPRTLDVDIVQIDGVTSDDPELTLPHPYAHERAFVLVPWLAADPDAALDGTPVRELVASLDSDEVAAVRELGE
ncbi:MULTISPECIES: 2-amino-4-hydroxy-6-hydroxymethyldihydropteridine diphosphokinase [Corynebacterium]|uniref:2-amino-4-hydroxy-6-hydroxymethyldihydropteridine diphosphokinase n=1 Tax=Corynebacterium singulare TaxID=161899 RepID=A0A0B6F3N8_9CORY|nr:MULTISPECIES: 2-amino-4-hydroxy-6-hydroxymethyldihydropteridine diphosphokinase [Corynebacterium]AJI79819.1 2-amino-4-hydroxy-6-hydroxymethyldihydropteridine diphosphokinase [Corynebacterium singulare]OFT60505.1 2-amino-4-hydroxy-6-hydroxymethyldihydropteridine diphosphokinase [Corynebacterium sp. HMSC05E07]